MTYGIKVTGADNNYQIDSSDTSPQFLAVKASGSVGNNGSPSTYAVGDILFGGFESTTANATKDILVNFDSSGVSPTFIDGGHFVVLRPTNTLIAAGEASGTYGIQIKNSGSPPAITFDSRVMSKGMEIKEVKATNSIAGGYPGVDSWDTQTDNEVYNGTGLKDIYICINSGSKHHGTVSGTTPPNAAANAWLGFRYIYDANGTSGKIKLINATVANFGGANNAYVELNNLQQIIIGKFIQ
jgi:hypothetical protein|tara:strand:+ start:1534 stop:2256 length:723 start_codon:yes stop_codon:yes gene_type:complete